jgi:hypothetical protein
MAELQWPFGHQSQHVLLAVGEGAERIPAATAYEQLRYEFRIERGAAPSDGGIQDAICAEGERFSNGSRKRIALRRPRSGRRACAIIEQLKIIETLTDPTAYGGAPRMRLTT